MVRLKREGRKEGGIAKEMEKKWKKWEHKEDQGWQWHWMENVKDFSNFQSSKGSPPQKRRVPQYLIITLIKSTPFDAQEYASFLWNPEKLEDMRKALFC